MRWSLALDPGRPFTDVVRLAQQVDEAGWHAVYVCDHFMPHDPGDRPVEGPFLECWTTLSALTGRTKRVRLGSLVLGNTYRHPAVVAAMAATLDHASGGRAILGMGAGWQPNEHHAFGIPLPDPATRIAALDEACQVIRSLLEQPRTSLAGRHYALVDAPYEPKPVQARLPLLVGGDGERLLLRVAARHADVWHTWADADTFARKCAVLDAHCAAVGRDPAAITRACGGTVRVTDGPGDGTPTDVDVVGDAAAVADAVARVVAAGAAEFVVTDDASATTVAEALRQVELLTERVQPRLP